MNRVTDFYRSQIGGASVINYSYTDFPWRLLARDTYYFFVYSWALPWILCPAFTYGSGQLDELYPTLRNAFCVLVHFVLAVLQLTLLVTLPVIAFWLPSVAAVAVAACFLLVNKVLCLFLNGNEYEFHSDEKYAKLRPEHEHEQWVFINGVAVGQHWLKNNLDRLAMTFKRPVLGIHNRTSGIIFDIIECLIQRNFSYATSDVRIIYRILKKILYDPSKSKVVLILHSQGAIEGGLVLDWLLQELPQDLLSKLEVYTFGNAANHFNNPHRHAYSQSLTKLKPLSAMSTIMMETTTTPTTADQESPVLADGTDGAGDGQNGGATQPSLAKETSSLSSTSRASVAAQDRAIGHVEHYAHSTDFVAIWGVLHFATNRTGSPEIPRFIGRLFSRSTGLGGHQFNQHYLDGMFPLERDPATGQFVGASEENEFMEEEVRLGKEGDTMDNVREAFDITYAGTQGFGSGAITTPVDVHSVGGRRKKIKGDVKVKDLSRLWSYRNGKSPDEIPTLLTQDVTGVVRNATM